ncbi:MAG: hypothetical protein KIT10_05015 [Flavobacteriales bacterium]|nr:hypothetical protein [Flavobacteriales bacterium]
MAWLYLFAIAATVRLGHYPVPSLNDPKDLDLDVMHAGVGGLAGASLYGVPVWLAVLTVAIRKGIPWRRNALIYAIGWSLLLLQLIVDPGRTFAWYAD